MVVAGAQTLAVACFAGTVLPVLAMGVAYTMGLEAHDMATPYPCIFTFKLRPKVKNPKKLPQDPGGPGNCTTAQHEALELAKKIACKAAEGACVCPSALINTKIALKWACIT